jgi:predicted MFS family arabinose efflux permease
MYVFFFLYSLYLLDRGFRENFLGLTTSAVIMGGVAGTLPAGLLVERLGLRKALLVCLTLVSLISAVRSVFVSAVPLLAFAFLGGFAAVIWAVAFSPAVAQLTSEKTRTFGFSIVFFFGIAVGVLGGQVGGRLPGWLMQLTPRLEADTAKEVALLLACGIIALGIIPASQLRFKFEPVRHRKTHSRNPYLIRFLVAIAVWSIAIGGFSPFFSAYFSRYWHMPVKQIGTIDSMARIPQLLAILAAPALFRKLGLVTGIAFTQIATAIALLSLAFASRTSAATAVYMGYVAFQWMNEPAIYALLMDHVEPNDRARASALNFLVVNSSQAIAGLAAGASFVRFGYPAVLAGTAGVAVAGALSFWLLLGKETVLSGAGALRSVSTRAERPFRTRKTDETNCHG